MTGLIHPEVDARVVPLGGRSDSKLSPRVPLQFRLLHVVGFLMTLPVVAMTRLLSDGLRRPRDESVFAETNRTVLTALGIGFMA